MDKPISPWAIGAERVSPDGRFTAHYDDAGEVGMGAPTMGRLTLISGDGERLITERAAASMVWSDDSKQLAFSEWTKERKQTLCVLDAESGQVSRHPDTFRVLELHGFQAGEITGVDSPIYMPKALSIPASSLA